MNIRKKIFKVLRMLLIYLAGVFAVAVVALFVLSPGNAKPFTDESGNVVAGSVAEIASVEIGGITQKMIIRGENEKNPVILFLHGGPGSPEYPFTVELRTQLEQDFTFCWWEQRGVGMSYSKDLDIETMTLEQMVSDTVEVTNYLREKFGQEKIYLMGHSWGSFLGMNVIHDSPQLYSAYVGIGQVSNQVESEQLAYDYMVAQAKETGDTKLEAELLKFADFDPTEKSLNRDYITGPRTGGLMKLGVGLMHENTNPMPGMIWKVITCREYSFKDKLWWMGLFGNSIAERLWPIVPKIDLMQEIPSVDVPVFIIQGKYDYQTSTVLAKEYFDKLKAPEKQYFVLENSAHGVITEEPEQFARIIKESLK
ncbi:MAG: alpha/beta hydrolase [Christensenellaceae bacterium]|jgi:pimeloyl-ACP methyl ester carboxylesterase|nr:alpha/beta hydrolase [Christensenellaceae bacterium]